MNDTQFVVIICYLSVVAGVVFGIRYELEKLIDLLKKNGLRKHG
jgi:uncharacterized membrane protein